MNAHRNKILPQNSHNIPAKLLRKKKKLAGFWGQHQPWWLHWSPGCRQRRSTGSSLSCTRSLYWAPHCNIATIFRWTPSIQAIYSKLRMGYIRLTACQKFHKEIFVYFDSARRQGSYFECVQLAIGGRYHVSKHMRVSTVHNQNKNKSPESETNADCSKSLR